MIEVTEESASHSKIAMASNMDIFINEDDDTIDKTDISYIWRSSSILVLLMYTLCPKCQKIKLDIVYKSSGISTKAYLTCVSCGIMKTIDMDYKNQKNSPKEINVKAVMGTMYGGGSFTLLKSIMAHMNIGCMVTNTYTSISKKITANAINVSIFGT